MRDALESRVSRLPPKARAVSLCLALAGSLIGLGCHMAMTVTELREKGLRDERSHDLPIELAAEYLRAFESLGCGEFPPMGGVVDIFVRSEGVLWVTVRGLRTMSDKAAVLYEVTPFSVTAHYRMEYTGARVRYALDRIAAGQPAVCDRR